MNTIDTASYYKLSEVVEMHPILRARGLRFLYDFRKRQAPELFTNVSRPGHTPRYLIKGSDVLALIHELDRAKPVTK